jgi:signal transduction histidine kinase/ligand-binding sensor domain-containing protein
VWIGCGASLSYYNGRDGTLKPFPVNVTQDFRLSVALPDFPQPLDIREIVEDTYGTLWLGARGGLVRLLPGGKSICFGYQYPEGNVTGGMTIDSQGRIWIGLGSGLGVLLPEAPSVSRQRNPSVTHRLLTGTLNLRASMDTMMLYLDPTPARALHHTGDSTIWIATMNGLFRAQADTLCRIAVEVERDRWFRTMTSDREGNLLAGTTNGLVMIHSRGFLRYFDNHNIHNIFEDHAGSLFVIHDRWRVGRLEGDALVSRQPLLPPDIIERFAIRWASNAGHRDRLGDWWFATNEGLFRWTHTQRWDDFARGPFRVRYSENNGLSTASVRSLFEDSRGNIWVVLALPGKGLSLWNRQTDRFRYFTEDDGYPTDRVPQSFCEDSAGAAWFGFTTGGLSRYNDGGFHSFVDEGSVPAGTISSLMCDRNGRIWIGSNKSGVSRLDSLSTGRLHVTTFTSKEGLSSNNVRCLTEDLQRNIYAGTARGVDRIDPVTGSIRHFTTKDGLAGDFVTCAYRDSKGDLWFGTYAGVSRLHPQVRSGERVPGTYFKSVRAGGVPIPISTLGETRIQGIELSPEKNQMEVEFFGISPSHGELLRYQYTLEAGTNTWSEPRRQRSLSLAGLAPGTYQLLVRAVSDAGIAGDTPAFMSFTIHPPFWQSWWFIAGCVVFVAGILLWLYRYRVNKAIEIERIRVRLASDLHDELASNLSSIAMFGGIAGTLEGDKEQFRSLAQRIQSLAQESALSVRDFIWALDPKTETVSDLLTRLKSRLGPACDAQGIRLEFLVPDDHDLPQGNLAPEVRKNLWLLLKEATTNIFKHSQCTELSLRATYGDGALQVEIHDNGKGFDVAGKSSGKGLGTIRMRAKELGGQVHVESHPGEGARMVFSTKMAR